MSRAYYNEHEPFAAAWLRALIAEGQIAPGDVDTRSITEVTRGDLDGYTQHHFFAGIGGWSCALRLAGWPDDRPVWTGSCPCQPFSAAGRGLGDADPRHLWPEFRRLIAECRPTTVFGEQVASAAGRGWLAGVRTDLERMGYAVGAADLCAASAGAPHIRQRLFWVADTAGARRNWEIGGPEGEARHEARVLLSCDNGATGGLADPVPTGWAARRAGTGDGSPPSGGATGGLEVAGCSHGSRGSVYRSHRPDPTTGEGERGPLGISSPPRGLGHPIKPGLEGQSRHGDHRHQSGRIGTDAPGSTPAPSGPSFWDTSVLIPCLDGKARRTQPEVFPLAHGIPNRVGTLRGAGNAIVPQVAAAFVTAYLEAR